MWHILMVFTMRSRDPNGGPNLVALGSLLRCLGCLRGPKRVVLRVPEGPFFPKRVFVMGPEAPFFGV